jgi:hypothetical protein
MLPGGFDFNWPGWLLRPITIKRRLAHHRPPEDTEPNSDFEFGPAPSIVELSRPSLAERRASKVLLLLLALLVLPSFILLVGFIFTSLIWPP